MATRKGATKTVSGKRYRYNGTKWVQIKATGNVTPTSSRNRSARSKVSNARVTGTTRNTSGSASSRVTGGQKALPARGGSSANSSGARNQRRGTAQRQVANQNNVFSQALRRTLKQRAAMDKAEKAAQGTKGTTTQTGTRTKGGALAQQGSSAVTRQGSSSKSGVTRQGSSSPTSQRIDPVRVRVEGPKTGGRGLPPALRNVLVDKGVLPPGQKGGEMSGSNKPRRRNINNNPSSGRTQTGSQSAASINRELAAVRRAKAEIGRNRMGPLSGLVERGLNAALTPVAEKLGYEGGKLIRKALGGGDPKLDKKGNPIQSSTPSSTPSTSQSRREKEQQYNRAVGAARRVVKSTSAASTPNKPPKPAGGAGGGRSGGSGGGRRSPAPIPTKKTGANNPRNAAYIAARSKLNSSSTKAQRDKVRDMGMEIHNKAFGKNPTKSKPTQTSPAQNLRQGRSPDPKKKKKKVLPYFGGNGIGRY